MALGVVAWPAVSETLPPIGSPTLDEATRNKILLISEGAEPSTPVSYTHLTLPTIYSV